jgi:hypothetical protein
MRYHFSAVMRVTVANHQCLCGGSAQCAQHEIAGHCETQPFLQHPRRHVPNPLVRYRVTQQWPEASKGLSFVLKARNEF